MPWGAALVASVIGCDDDYLLPPPEVGEDRIDVVLSASGDPSRGQGAFDAHCASCHDPAGISPSAGPPLAALVPEASDTHLVEVMLTGVGAMPAVDLTDQEAADLLAWMRDRFDVPHGGDTDAEDTDIPADSDSDSSDTDS